MGMGAISFRDVMEELRPRPGGRESEENTEFADGFNPSSKKSPIFSRKTSPRWPVGVKAAENLVDFSGGQQSTSASARRS
jgi:hypothetical protein